MRKENESLKIEVTGSGVVCSRPDQHYGWPGMARINGKEILVAASERKHHICPFGRMVVIRSKDNGNTWENPQEIYNSELDDRDATLAVLPDGTIVVGFFTDAGWMQPKYCREEWKARCDRVTEKMLEELVGDWMLYSYDGGYTWEKILLRMPDGGAEHSGPFTLSNGSLACFGYEKDKSGLQKWFYRSEDRGKTWHRMGHIPCINRTLSNFPWRLCRWQEIPAPCVNENSLLELGPDHFLAMFRTKDMQGYLVQSYSEDGGRTWSVPKSIGIVGKPPHLLRLANGALLCSYSHRAEPWSIRAVLSFDEGRTWERDNVITIQQWKDHPDMGYPVSMEVARNEILTVYYCSRQPLHMPEYENTFIHGSTPEGILFKRFKLHVRRN